jgi:hypothetical protein
MHSRVFYLEWSHSPLAATIISFSTVEFKSKSTKTFHMRDIYPWMCVYLYNITVRSIPYPPRVWH